MREEDNEKTRNPVFLLSKVLGFWDGSSSRFGSAGWPAFGLMQAELYEVFETNFTASGSYTYPYLQAR
jgi:hypothetical protein